MKIRVSDLAHFLLDQLVMLAAKFEIDLATILDSLHLCFVVIIHMTHTLAHPTSKRNPIFPALMRYAGFDVFFSK